MSIRARERRGGGTNRDKRSDQSFEEIKLERIVFVNTLSYKGPVPTETMLMLLPCEDCSNSQGSLSSPSPAL